MGYRKVDQQFWTDEKVMRWDTDTQHLALYLLTNQHSTSEGFYQLKKLYMMADLDWERERFNKAFGKLLKDGFLKYDESVSIVFLPNTLKYNAPDNPNQAIGAVQQLSKLPDTNLIEDFLEKAKEYGNKIIDILEDSNRELDYNCLPNPSPNGSGNIRNPNSNPNSNSNTKDLSSGSEPPEENSLRFNEDSTQYQLALQLRERIVDFHNPTPGNIPKPNPEDMDKWSYDIDKLIRLGEPGGEKSGPTPDQTEFIFHWIYDIDDFWRDTIRSPHGIRKNLSTITAQIRKWKKNKNGTINGQSEKDYIKEL